MLSILLLLLAAPVAAPARTTCALTEADKVANRAMTFAEFDQARSDRPSTGWNLSIAGCYAEAMEAEQDYLLNGPPLTEHERTVVAWHMTQNLASLGKEAEAAPLAALAIYDAPPAEDGFDWNTYVRGVWGFLRKDRPTLDAALAGLRAAPGQRNAINAGALARLSACFERPYDEASRQETCPVAPEPAPVAD